MAWHHRMCKACGRLLAADHIPWHSRKHPDIEPGVWIREYMSVLEVVSSGTELAPVCPRCEGKDVLDVVMMPQAAKAAKHVVDIMGSIVAQDVCWDDKFEEPPEEHRHWCQDCEAYITPEWEKVK